jgi:hypothetical protein
MLVPMTAIPKTRLVLYVAILLLIVMYSMWSFLQPPKPNTTKFTELKPAVDSPKVAGPVLLTPIKIVPKTVVRKTYPTEEIAEDEEVIDTGEIPPAENGGVIITKIDTKTSEAHTDFKPNPAPWLGFENKNYLGIGLDYDVLNSSEKAKIYYKRDILRSKDVHFQVELQVRVPVGNISGKVDVVATPNIEWRF